MKSSSFSSCLACIPRSCEGKASRWNVAKHHRGKLLNSDRASRIVEAVERREKKRRGRGEGFSRFCLEFSNRSAWLKRMILLAETIETFPPGLNSTQLLINTQVFDCIRRRKNGMQPAAAILGYITIARCREQFQRNSKFARRRSQLPPQVNTPHTEHGRLSQIQFRSFQSMINPHYWNRKR